MKNLNKETIILLIFLLIVFIGVYYFLHRNESVLDFRINVSQAICDYNIKENKNLKLNDVCPYEYSTMVYSFKSINSLNYINQKYYKVLKPYINE